MTPTNADLRQFILNFFSDEELETLCFDYFREVRQNFTDGMTKNRKVILLISYCDTRGRLNDLYAALERERSTVWREKFGAPPVETGRRPVSTPMTPTRDPRQVFISHATADAAFAHRLADDLRAEGWRVWIAPDSIRPGEKWVEAIERGLETSGVFVVALTPAAVTSRWVRMETNAAIGLSQQDEIRFISLDVEECRLSTLWRQFQYISFRRSYEMGLGELLRWLEREDPLPNPHPEGEGAGGLPTRPTTPAEKRVKEEQWRQLQALAHEIAALLGQQSGDDETREVFRRFNRHFGLTTYKKLPRWRFVEGLAFLTEWRDEVAATVPQASLASPLPQAEEVIIASSQALRSNPPQAGEGESDASPQDPLPQENEVSPVTPQDVLPSPSLQEEQVVTSAPPLSSSTAPFPGYRVLSTDRIVHEKTEIEFVRVSAGTFLYGDANKQLELPEFWIGCYPVTNAQYKHFLDANPAYPVPFRDKYRMKPYTWDKKTRAYPTNKADHPVVLVSWNDAKAFCDWAGLHLPTEEKWEKAARGDKDGRVYPWGNNWIKWRCNTAEAGVGGTTRVGRYSPQGDSPYGCADMAGNVWELTASWYDQKQSGRVMRGGSWYFNRMPARVSVRLNVTLDDANYDFGFRVVAPVDVLVGVDKSLAAGGTTEWVGGTDDLDLDDPPDPVVRTQPTADQLFSKLEEYLRSFGADSEFGKEIEYIEGIGPANGQKLRSMGIVTVLDLMVEGATRSGRKRISDRTEISASQILTWVNHIDLFRIKGVAQQYADLLEQSGVDTVMELAQRNPNNLFKRMSDINQQKQLVRRMPRSVDVESWVEQAKNLKRVIHY